MDFLNKFFENVEKFPDRPAVRTAGKRYLSYLELDEYSAKVYRWLNSHAIGTEDMVLIFLPRGSRLMVSVIGVMKAGAAFVIAETNSPEERIAFIKKDCSCRTVIDEELYSEMMKEEPLSGHKKPAKHDACFAVYTSGTTGNPKGVIHEYGKLDVMIPALLAPRKQTPGQPVYAYLPPTSFVAFIYAFLSFLYLGSCFVLVPVDIGKDPVRLYELLCNCGVTDTFMPPSMIRITDRLPECLVNLHTGSEPCNAIYKENVNLIVLYSSTELGTILTTFVVDRPYEITPVGKNHTGTRYYILDNDGHRVPQGEKGEICAEIEYTRGYINLPEKTREVFVDGLYHTRDIGYIGEDGNLYVSGRMDDMIKINGNRVEPGEIEVVIRREFGVENVVVKGFQEKNRSFLAAFFLKSETETKNILLTPEDFRNALSKNLPYYMIPTYYIGLEEFPKSVNGKIDRKKLMLPDAGDFAKEYAAPVTETEKHFCDLFAKTLKIEKVGVNDDFYLIGGDSLSAIELIRECKYKNVSVNQIYSCRTPRKIAEYIDTAIDYDDRSASFRNTKAKEHELPVLPEMGYVVDYQLLSLRSIMWNLPILVRFEDGVDADRLARAVKKALSSHPALSTVIFFNENGDLCQKYVPDLQGDVPIENITENEFCERKKHLVRSFAPVNKVLHRETVFLTEKSVYLFIDFYHIISDGTSVNLIMDQIIRLYKDETCQIPEDHYYLIVSDYFRYIRGKEFQEIVSYYKDVYRRFRKQGEFGCLPVMDRKSHHRTSGWFKSSVTISKEAYHANPFMAGMGENDFFMTACVLSIARYNHQNNSFLQWTFHGRKTADELNSAGMLFKSLPLFSSPQKGQTLRDYCEDIVRQAEFGKSTSNVLICDAVGMELEDTLFFLYQKNMFNLDRLDHIREVVPLDIDDPAVDSIIEFEIIDNDGEDTYTCTIEYSADNYDHGSMERFFCVFDDTVKRLIDCSDPDRCTVEQILEEL